MAENFISVYEEYAAEATDAPPCYHPFIAHAILGCAAGKRVWVPGFGARKIHPNRFLLILGNSSRTRKTTSVWLGTRLLSAASIPQIIGTASPESIRDEIEEAEPDSWFHIEEFGRVLKMLQKDYARDLDLFFCQLYDGVCKGRTKREGRVLREDLAMTLFTSSPQRTLETLLTREDLSTGFIARFTIVPAPQDLPAKQPRPSEIDENKANLLIAHLHKLHTMHPHKATVTPEAEAIITEGFMKIERQLASGAIPDILDASACRLQDGIWRFALSSACANLDLTLDVDKQPTQRPTIVVRPEDARTACQCIGWLVDKLLHIASTLAFSQRAAEYRDIENQIRAVTEIKRRDLLNNNRHLQMPDMDEIIRRLVSEEVIEEVRKRTGKRGPTTQFYRYCGNGKAEEPEMAEAIVEEEVP